MKMISAGTANIHGFAPYSRNCAAGQCVRKYYASVPSVGDIELFINLGTVKPTAIEFQYLNLCNNQTASLTSNCFIIAYNGQYWYAVYKKFYATSIFDSYIIFASVTYEDASERSFFSEQYQNATSCDTLTKLSVCYPYNFNSEDLNGIYIGQPNLSQPVSGNAALFYHHNYWIKQGEVIETANKITFTSSMYRNFATTLNKNYELRPELVPGWYKDYLLAIYSRGDILIDGVHGILSGLNFDNVDSTPSGYWKAYAVLTKTVKSAFGCATYQCAEECVPVVCVPVSIPDFTLPSGSIGTPYYYSVLLTGTGPFILSDIIKPAWMTISITGNNIVFTGTPTDNGTFDVSAIVTNDCGSSSFSNTITVTVISTGPFQITSLTTTGQINSVNFDDNGWYNISPGVFPIFNGQARFGTHTSYMGILEVDCTVSVDSRIFVQVFGGVPYCVGRIGTGHQIYTVAVVFAAGDDVRIYLTDGNIC